MMSRENGYELKSEIDQIRQSIQDILTTPIGTRVMRREYGSLIFQLIDFPFDDITRLQLFAATTMALLRWENRVQINSISVVPNGTGSFTLDLDCNLIDSNKQASLSIPLNFGSSL
ncbi:MAG: GPW/gp25 family protein [Acinetobacter sp.]|nr:GPW/gp25 family protein [Acinetobacter sp.]